MLTKRHVLPTGGGQASFDASDAVSLLMDHQTGLFQTVKDIGIAALRANTTMLATLATLFDIAVITSASEPDGPNGPLMPEIEETAPRAVYVPRTCRSASRTASRARRRRVPTSWSAPKRPTTGVSSGTPPAPRSPAQCGSTNDFEDIRLGPGSG